MPAKLKSNTYGSPLFSLTHIYIKNKSVKIVAVLEKDIKRQAKKNMKYHLLLTTLLVLVIRYEKVIWYEIYDMIECLLRTLRDSPPDPIFPQWCFAFVEGRLPNLFLTVLGNLFFLWLTAWQRCPKRTFFSSLSSWWRVAWQRCQKNKHRDHDVSFLASLGL